MLEKVATKEFCTLLGTYSEIAEAQFLYHGKNHPQRFTFKKQGLVWKFWLSVSNEYVKIGMKPPL